MWDTQAEMFGPKNYETIQTPKKKICTLRRKLGKLCFSPSAPVLNYLGFIKRPRLPNFAHKNFSVISP